MLFNVIKTEPLLYAMIVVLKNALMVCILDKMEDLAIFVHQTLDVMVLKSWLTVNPSRTTCKLWHAISDLLFAAKLVSIYAKNFIAKPVKGQKNYVQVSQVKQRCV